ncbi:hypothetical protein [Streptomyces sp. NBC_00503]|uniref:hypothetical protein n=1 Tax=Streptomyces sp. NBC_00503 TaxID=2903659 RepID=UPI002E823058|nr:hypothetical protein [Streptomyces sp. NBC_00503]WUD83215.1 hypothetical protein OG490_23120 [Streptomyces sp. NBC_00503]
MADERDRWLDRAAADRLLRGEPATPGAEHHARARAERLRAALDALAEPPPSVGGELPGEAAALAAFRAARGTVPLTESGGAGMFGSAETVVELSPPGTHRGAGSGSGHGPGVSSGSGSHSGSGPRRHRPVRFVLAAAVASVAVGGLAAAAGAGLLDHDTYESAGRAPAVSVGTGDSSAAAGGSDPTLIPQPKSTRTPGSGTPGATADPGSTLGADGRTPSAPDAAAGGMGTGGGSATGPSANGSTPGRESRDRFLEGGTDNADKDRDSRTGAVGMCRDFRAGKLDGDRREKLVRLAKGLLRIPRYCQTILDGSAGGAPRGEAPAVVGGSTSTGAPTLTPAEPAGGAQGVDGSLGLHVRS